MSYLAQLHCHTLASDGMHTPQALMQQAEDLGYSAVAITDHNTLAGYDQACQSAHIIPLLAGCEFTVYDAEMGISGHLTVLFPDGPALSVYDTMQSLCALPERARTLQLLAGIPCLILSGCRGSVFHRRADRVAPFGTPEWGLAFGAQLAAAQQLFGDRFYLEVMRDSHLPAIIGPLVKLLKIRHVVTSDVHGSTQYPLPDPGVWQGMYTDSLWQQGIIETGKIAQRLRAWEGWAIEQTPQHDTYRGHTYAKTRGIPHYP